MADILPYQMLGDDRDKEIVKERYISPENDKKLLMI